MSNRIAVFEDGIIQQLASPDELYERPENAFVAGFIGENNRFNGKVLSLNGATCEVEVESGHTVRALSVNVAGAGLPTTLSLRPERVVVDPAEGQFVNTVEARVEELIYLGDHIRVRASVCGNDDFIIKVPNASGHAALEPGATMNIGWSAEDCRALDA
jgi:putative spermidine/putrescine transport system ATP-binding protein